MSNIHPSSVIHENATVPDSVSIGPFCVVGEHVTLGENVKLHSHVVVEGRTTIGEGTEIFPFASIGHRNQDLKFKGEPSVLIIGKNNVIREYCSMQPGTKDGGMKTVVGDNGLFMVGCHIAHDVHVGNNVIFANNVQVAGHVHIGDYVIMGATSAVHQNLRIGRNAIVGGASALDTDVIPFGRVKGERASLEGLNIIGLERNGFSRDQIKKLMKVYKFIFTGEGTMDARLEQAKQDYADDDMAMQIIDFAMAKEKFPLCAPKKA